MLALAAGLAQSGTIGFDGCLIAVVALMSSFGPVIALANLGTGLQNTFAAGNRVLDVLDEQPTVREVTGRRGHRLYRRCLPPCDLWLWQ